MKTVERGNARLLEAIADRLSDRLRRAVAPNLPSILDAVDLLWIDAEDARGKADVWRSRAADRARLEQRIAVAISALDPPATSLWTTPDASAALNALRDEEPPCPTRP